MGEDCARYANDNDICIVYLGTLGDGVDHPIRQLLRFIFLVEHEEEHMCEPQQREQ